MIKLNLSYCGKFISQKEMSRHYQGWYKNSISTDPDTLDVGLLTETLVDMFKYHRDSKIYYKKNGETFVSGMKQVKDDNDIRAIKNLCTMRDDNSFEIYVDHELPKDHRDAQINKVMVKQLGRLENGLVLKDIQSGVGRAKYPHIVDGSVADLYVKDINKRIEGIARKMSELGTGNKAKNTTTVQPNTAVHAPATVVPAPATAVPAPATAVQPTDM